MALTKKNTGRKSSVKRVKNKTVIVTKSKTKENFSLCKKNKNNEYIAGKSKAPLLML